METPLTLNEVRDEAQKSLLTSQPGAAQVLRAREHAKTLKQQTEFGLARRLLDKVWVYLPKGFADGERLKVAQQRALCTYRDVDLPIRRRLQRAFEILTDDADLAHRDHPETLGQAGAVYKRRWEAFGLRDDLERSLNYYRLGHAASQPDRSSYDFGWNAINEAYLLDLLDDLDHTQARQQKQPPAANVAAVGEQAQSRHDLAQGIRREIVRTLPEVAEGTSRGWVKSEWWYHATLAEAHLGLDDYGAAARLVTKGLDAYRQANQQDVPIWEQESTARQLLNLERLKAARKDAAPDFEQIRAVLQPLIGDSELALRQLLIGKVGLALSGGGFRASLFHIGVLARLAELDLLRSVDVISCVSGGSIVGAYYYLKLRTLLESRPDQARAGEAGQAPPISKEDYVDLVRELAGDFLKSVQTNIRMRLFTPCNAWSLALHPQRTATDQLAELYEAEFYRPLAAHRADPSLRLRDLYVVPQGEPWPQGGERPSFNPKHRNWRRAAKVPILVLNATSLNTGHVWQFTASYLGESPSRIEQDVDANERLRRVYYWDAPADAPARSG